MEGLVDGGEHRRSLIIRQRGQNLLQTFVLLLAIGEDVNLVTLQLVVLKCLFQQVEVLMEKRLYGDIEPQSGRGLC